MDDTKQAIAKLRAVLNDAGLHYWDVGLIFDAVDNVEKAIELLGSPSTEQQEKTED